MNIIAYFKARAMAKEFVEIALFQQALSSIEGLPGFDEEDKKALKPFNDEIQKKYKQFGERLRSAGPSAAEYWRSLTKKRFQNTKGAALIPYLEQTLTERFGKHAAGEAQNLITDKSYLNSSVDGPMIRLAKLFVDKMNLPDQT